MPRGADIDLSSRNRGDESEQGASSRRCTAGCHTGRAVWSATRLLETSGPACTAAMIESVAAARLPGDDRGARDRAGGRLAQGVLRAVREQGSSASWRPTTSSSRAPASACSTRGSRSAAGPTACTPAARRCSTTSLSSPRDRGWCSSTRSASGPRRRERMQLAGLDVRAPRRGRLPGGARRGRLPRLTARAIVGGVRHVVFTRMLEHREQELYALTDEVLDWIESYRIPAVARLGRAARRARRDRPPAPAAFLASRRQARARARLGRPPDARRRLCAADRPADRAVRGHVDRGLPQAVPEQGGVLPGRARRIRRAKRSMRSGRSFESASSWHGGRVRGDGARSSNISSPTRRCCGSRSSTCSKSGPAMVGRMTARSRASPSS